MVRIAYIKWQNSQFNEKVIVGCPNVRINFRRPNTDYKLSFLQMLKLTKKLEIIISNYKVTYIKKKK